MEQNFQTSFIPKKPIVGERAVATRSISIFTILSVTLLFTVILATGGFYLSNSNLVKTIKEMENTLELAKGRFTPSKITELQLLDKRLRASSEILFKHITVTPIFQTLADITMKTVRYSKFSYDFTGEKDLKVAIKMSGLAAGYRAVALQSDLFAKNKNLIDPVFSNLTLDDKGNVLFELNFSVDLSFVNYKQTLQTAS